MDLPRTLLPLIEYTFQRFPVVILTGPRLSGKKTLARSVFEKKPSYYFTFEDPELRLKAQHDPKGILKGWSGNIILKDIHRVPQLFAHLAAHIDSNPSTRLILLSSQTLDLGSLIQEDLVDRVKCFTLLPFANEELPKVKNEKLNFSMACWLGGYHGMMFRDMPASHHVFSQYIHSFIEKDVLQLKSIEDTSTFLLFMKECAKRVGQLLNLAAIAKECGIAANTAKAWLEVLEKGYMVYRLPPHAESFGRRVVKVPKLYFYDTGLLCNLLEIKEASELEQHEAYKMIAENYLLNEIVKSFHHRGQSVSSLYFWRDLRGKEVDCLIEYDGRLRGIDLQPLSMTELEIDVRGMEHWQKLSKCSMYDSVIVYGGDKVKIQINSSVVFGWQDALSVTNGILIRDLSKFYKDLKKRI